MTDMPSASMYHRWLGWHAVDLRRTLVVAAAGLAVVLALMPAIGWGLASISGWDAAATVFLLTTWPIIIRADGHQTKHIAVREDATRGTATVLLLAASVASLFGVGVALELAGQSSGSRQVALISLGVMTVVLSWILVNTTYTLRYAHLQYRRAGDGIAFDGTSADQPPTYRDFAYTAFTIGMTYQVSDTTLHDSATRGTVLSHALLAYLFGVVIVAGAINLIAGLVR